MEKFIEMCVFMGNDEKKENERPITGSYTREEGER